MNNKTDEIDLTEILADLTLAIKKNLKILLIAFVIGSGLGLAYYQLVPNIYESEMIITSDILTESYSKSVFANIQKLLKEQNTTSLSTLLNISPSQAAAISSIKLRGTSEKSDLLQEKDRTHINITVESTDNSIWPALQTGITTFIENNDFVKIRVEQKKKAYSSLIKKIDHELSDLEMLKSKIMEGKLSTNSKDGMLLLDPTMINTKIIELSKDRIKYQDDLDLVNSVQVVGNFTAFEKPISPKLSISLVAGSSFGLFLVLILIGFKSLKTLVRLAEEKVRKD